MEFVNQGGTESRSVVSPVGVVLVERQGCRVLWAAGGGGGGWGPCPGGGGGGRGGAVSAGLDSASGDGEVDARGGDVHVSVQRRVEQCTEGHRALLLRALEDRDFV